MCARSISTALVLVMASSEGQVSYDSTGDAASRHERPDSSSLAAQEVGDPRRDSRTGEGVESHVGG